jgi:hypothetical protein
VKWSKSIRKRRGHHGQTQDITGRTTGRGARTEEDKKIIITTMADGSAQIGEEALIGGEQPYIVVLMMSSAAAATEVEAEKEAEEECCANCGIAQVDDIKLEECAGCQSVSY